MICPSFFFWDDLITGVSSSRKLWLCRVSPRLVFQSHARGTHDPAVDIASVGLRLR